MEKEQATVLHSERLSPDQHKILLDALDKIRMSSAIKDGNSNG